MAERVVDKERANFCEYFAPSPGDRASSPPPPMQAAPGRAARAELEALFKKQKP
jgi:hypothetical protein